MALLDTVIVGAGMAGLVCARRLQQAGYQVAILEKSRGLGGRMATRRLDGIPLDHGARFLHPQGDRPIYLANQLIQPGVLQSWHPQSFFLDKDGTLSPTAVPPCYVAPAGMSAVGKAIAADLAIFRQQRVTRITPQSDSWHIQAVQQMGDGSISEYGAKTLVLALPAPQILPLLASIPSHSAVPESLLEAISTVAYAPCITVLAQYESPLDGAAGSLPCDPTTPWMVEAHPDTSFFWIGLDSSKRQTDGLNVVLHSSAQFAEAYLEAPTLQTVGETLLAQASQLISPWLAASYRWQVHRWRYAQVTVPHTSQVPGTDSPVPLVTCGDWTGCQGINSALESGWQAADWINEKLAGTALPDIWTVL